MKTINKPHDKFFKKSLSDLTVAKDFLETHLPANILARFNLDKIKICKESYIDEELNEQFTDVVYNAEMDSGATGYIYILIEHQSSSDKLMPLRVAKYQLAIMTDHMLNYKQDQKLPAVFPILFYHGIESPYPYTLNFLDLFHDPNFAAEHFARKINIIDLTVMPDEEISKHKSIALLEFAQKHIRARDFLILTDFIVELLNKLPFDLEPINEHLQYINAFFRYIISEGNISNVGLFKKILESTELVRENKLMGTAAQYFREEGRQEGLTLIVNNMLAKKLPFNKIAELTGLSNTELKKLAKQETTEYENNN